MSAGRFSIIVLACALLARAAMAEKIEFLRDVRPILSSHCFKCHGPDATTRKGDLRLDIREEAVKKAILPGKTDESEVIRRLFTADEDDLMPPPSAKHPLSDKQKETLRQWVAEGADYQPHWAFVAPKNPVLPPVKNAAWPRNEIDFFVLARLEKEGLRPSAHADRHALARRAALDLTGLPPAPAQVEAFVNDSRPDAYERFIDQLLASPRYGERWARRWLDLARYADTNGYEKDRPRSIWLYRDWVINALNDDMPFNQFTVEQIAGDMLPNATTNQIVATGFHRNTMINEEGGIDPLEYRFYAMVDRVHVTATAWLGLTMACAQCHTHKYDPIQQTEYYQFMALLNNADEPKIEIADPRIAEKRTAALRQIETMRADLASKFPPAQTIVWTTPARAEFSSENGSEAEQLADGSFRVSGKAPEKDNYTVRFEAELPSVTHLQIEAIPDENAGPGRTDHGNFVLNEVELEVETGGAKRKLSFSSADADFSQDSFPAENAIDGKNDTGWAISSEKVTRTHRRLILELSERLPLNGKTAMSLRLVQQHGTKHTLGHFRVSLGADLSPATSIEERRRENLELKFAKWLKREQGNAAEWTRLRPVEASSDTPVLTIEEDDGVFAAGDFTKNDTYRLKFASVPAGTTAIRLQALPDDRLPLRGPGSVSYEGPEGDFFLSSIKARAGEKGLKFKSASESYADEKNTAAKALDDDLQSGWSVKGGIGREQNAVFVFDEPFAGGELNLDLIFERYYAAGLGRFRIWSTTASDPKASALPERSYEAILASRSELNTQNRKILMTDFLDLAPELAKARREIDKARGDMPKNPTTLVMRERQHPRATHRHHRGEFLQAKETVEPGVPSFLGSGSAPRNRLEFARWLVSERNPLTARVVMNRHWEAFFGRGIVRTTEDFGFQGELPSHPELLDWLATEFMRQGWSQKKMHKAIVMSATYQQSAALTPELRERDPINVLLARGPRFRLESEAVRDSVLLASGLLTDKLGGPSVYPPQPSNITTEGAYGALTWKASEGADRYRRALYTFAKRTAPFAMNLTFDGSSGEACLARRDRSNTPLQALTLLNDEMFMECARAVGRWASQKSSAPADILSEIFRNFLARPPAALEQRKLADFYEAQLARLKDGELKAAEISGAEASEQQAAWTLVARVILNLDETITKP